MMDLFECHEPRQAHSDVVLHIIARVVCKINHL